MWNAALTRKAVGLSQRTLLSTVSAPKARLFAKGTGLYGALGLGDNLSDQSTFQEVLIDGGNEIPAAVGTGWAHSVAVTESGKAYMWGRPHDFTNILRLNRIEKVSKSLALLSAKVSNSFVFGNVFGYFPVPIAIENLPPIQSVTCSAGLTILLSRTGELYSFGYNRWEQCGIPNHKKDILEQPQRVLGLPACVKVDAGLQHVLALSKTGQVLGWGKCNKGQLGFGRTETTHNAPVKIPISDVVVDVSAGFLHNAAVSEAGDLYVWGKGMSDVVTNKMGMLQVADVAWEPRRIRLPRGLRATGVFCSNFAVTIRAHDGSLWAMGMGEHDRNANPSPVEVTSDFVAADGSTATVFDSVVLMRKGQTHVSVHTSREFVAAPSAATATAASAVTTDSSAPTAAATTTAEARYRSFEVVLHRGEAYLRPLSFEGLPSQATGAATFAVVDYSSGWKHDLAVVR